MTSFTSLKSWMLLALLFVAGQAAAQQVILSEDFSNSVPVKKVVSLLHLLLICLMPRLHIH